MDRYIQFAVAAAMEAMTDSALEADTIDLDRTGVSLGSAVGGTMVLEDGYVAVSNHGKEWLVDPDYAPPFLYQGLIPSSLASEVALKLGAHGPSVVVSTGCTSGIDAIGYGHQMIQDDEADIVIAGAAESGISPISMACFDPIKATSRRNDDAEHASRPFDRDRDGFVMGEGGAVLILEEMQSALARGAHIYCEVTGFASRGNAFHMTGLKPDASEMSEAILDAMAQGDTKPEDIDYINAHGSGTKQNDRHETAASRTRWASTPTTCRSARSSRWSATRSGGSARSRWRPARWRSTAAWCRRPPTGRTPTPSATSTTRPRWRCASRSTWRSQPAAASAASSRR